MKIWIDMLTPKQVLFLGEVAEKLRGKGVDILITIRRFRETLGVSKTRLERYIPLVIGQYGGALLVEKLRRSLERAQEMIPYIERFTPNLALSFSSPEAARVSYGLGIPHYSANDIPEAEAVARLTIPLSRKLFTPWIIPKKTWTKYGIRSSDIIYYRGLDPVAWLTNYHFNPNVPIKLGVKKRRYIVIRTVEAKVSYQLPILRRKRLFERGWIPQLAEQYKDYDIVVVGRYIDQIMNLIKVIGNYDNIIIPNDVVDGPSLLKYCNLFIGYGGTMTVESALLGKPTLSLRPGKLPYYLKYLLKFGLITHLYSEADILEKIDRVMSKKRDIRRLAGKLWREMENPADVISNYILSNVE
jgi:hypothetical protein